MLTIQIRHEQGQRLLLAALIAVLMAVLMATVQGAETKPAKPTNEPTTKPSDPSTQSVPYYDPMMAFCSTLDPWSPTWYFFDCIRFMDGAGK